MLVPFYAAFAVALAFYLCVPLIGAFMIRQKWRRFRAREEELRLAPLLRYRDVAGGGDRRVGRFRLYGSVEALEGRDRLWLRGEGVSALVDLSLSPLYVLANGSGEPGSVRRTPWKAVTSLAEGTRMLAAGLLVLEGGKPVFVEAPGEALLAVSYDCQDSVLASRLLSGGRAANEYWTPLSQLSIALGIAAMSAILVLFWRQIQFPTVRAMTFLVGVLPVLPFVPPGLFPFLLYRSLWRKALAKRIARDLYRMPLAYFPGGAAPSSEAPLPSGGRYVARPLARVEDAPPGALAPEPAAEPGGEALLFIAEGSADPAAEPVLTSGEPGALAAAAARRAAFVAAAAGLSIALAALSNYAIGILLWRRFL